MKEKRTIEETIEMFEDYYETYDELAEKAFKAGDMNKYNYYRGKREAYELAAFELTRNLIR